jgi:alpha-tubulin suppressor-like RCC1 family protein
MQKTPSKPQSKRDYTQVFSWGSDKYGQLGLGQAGEEHKKSNESEHLLPKYWSYNTPIVAVSWGAAHTLLLTPHWIYSMGSNIEGQLGIGDRKVKQKNAPVLIENVGICHPVKISAGSFHSTCIMNNGEVYAWGRGDYGWLGIGTDTTQFIPIKVEFDEPMHPFIIQISAGGSHTLCLDQQGRVYSFGNNGKLYFNL